MAPDSAVDWREKVAIGNEGSAGGVRLKVGSGLMDDQGARVRLIAQHRNARQPVRELRETITVLGSGDGCDLILASSKVDATHAAIVRLNGTAYLCDLGAPGGTTLNGRRVRWARLVDGDQPAIGPFVFRVELQEGSIGQGVGQPSFQVRGERSIGTIRSIDPILVLGSDSGCDVVLKDATVSPRHALIIWTQSGPVLRDLLRRNSVRCNGEKTYEAILHSGDLIGLGRYELQFETIDEAFDSPVASTEDEASELYVPGYTNEECFSAQENAAAVYAPSMAVPLIQADVGIGGTRNIERAEDLRQAAESVLSDTLPSGEGVSAAWRKREEEIRQRVVAAQQALDTRARKLREELEHERRKLRAYQEELENKSHELLKAAQEKNQELSMREAELQQIEAEKLTAGQAESSTEDAKVNAVAREKPAAERESSATIGGGASEDVNTLERLFGGLFEPEAATLRNAEETARLAASLVTGGIRTPEADSTLARQAIELTELVRFEREEMENAEGRLETLRFEIERLQSSVTRSLERQNQQEAQLESRLATIRATQAALRAEREELASKVRQIEAREAALKARQEEADRVRREAEREHRQFCKLQEEYEERRRELRLSLETERHRLRVRQAEMQKKAAELVKAAKEKRRIIEAEVASRQAEIDEREIELRSRRAALEDAGRAQLERTAAELEQVLTVRLNDVEGEISRRQAELDQRMEQLMAATGNTIGSVAESGATPLEMTIEEIETLARLEAAGEESDALKLQTLQGEVEALRQAVGRVDAQEALLRETTEEAQLSALASRRAQLQREQRWASLLRSKLNEKVTGIRGAAGQTNGGTSAVKEPTKDVAETADEYAETGVKAT